MKPYEKTVKELQREEKWLWNDLKGAKNDHRVQHMRHKTKQQQEGRTHNSHEKELESNEEMTTSSTAVCSYVLDKKCHIY